MEPSNPNVKVRVLFFRILRIKIMPRPRKVKAVEPELELEIKISDDVKRIPNLDVFPKEVKEDKEEKPKLEFVSVIEIEENKDGNSDYLCVRNATTDSLIPTVSRSNLELEPQIQEIQETVEAKSFLTKENFQKLSKAILVNPLFSLFLINLLLDGILLKGALWLFIAICIIDQSSVNIKK